MNRFCHILLIFLLLITTDTINSKESAELYAEIHNLFIKWHEGLFGSASFYHRALYGKLSDSIGKNIKTEYDYIYVDNVIFPENSLKIRFSYDGWLIIESEIDPEVKKKIISKNRSRKKIFLSDMLISIEGRISDFRMDRKDSRKNITLILKDVKIHFYKETP